MTNETVICSYRIRAGEEDRFRGLVDQHWTLLHDLGFVTNDRSQLLRHIDEPTYVEIFTWVEGGFGMAHEHPDVLSIWEQMEPLLEERDSRPKWEFPHYLRLDANT
jgi:hypothetical protein